MNTHRHPRTMQQAFGPYTSHELRPMRQPAANRVYSALLAVCIGILAALLIVHELAK